MATKRRADQGRKMKPATARRERVIPMLASGMSHRAVAEELAVNESTITHMASEAEVRAAVEALTAAAGEAARAVLLQNAPAMASALVAKALTDGAPGDTRAIVAALGAIGVGSTSKVQVTVPTPAPAALPEVSDERLPFELLRALGETLRLADVETRRAIRGEVAALVAALADDEAGGRVAARGSLTSLLSFRGGGPES